MCTYTLQSSFSAAKEKEKAAKLAAQKAQAAAKASAGPKKKAATPASGTATPVRRGTADAQQLDIAGLNLQSKEEPVADEPPPKLSMAREKVLEEARQAMEAANASGNKAVSIVVIGMFPTS